MKALKSAFIPRHRLDRVLKKAKSSRAGASGQWCLVPEKVRLYTLEVFLIAGPITVKFAKTNRVVSRTIQIRGDQTLKDLHHAIFDAYHREQEHFYQFQFGKRPMDTEGPSYGLPTDFEVSLAEDRSLAGRVDQTTIESLGLKVGRSFGYWFDFGDDWWHQINVERIDERVPKGRFPKVIKRQGKSPPQYPPEDEELV